MSVVALHSGEQCEYERLALWLAGSEPSVAECLLAQRPRCRLQNARTRGREEISSHSSIKLSISYPRRKIKKNELAGFWNFLFISSKPLQQTFLTNLLYSHYPFRLLYTPISVYQKRGWGEDRPCRKGMRNQVNIRWQKRGNLSGAMAGRRRLIHRHYSIRASLL